MVTVNGFAKINLTLDILGTREDGFHEVSMVMQSLALHDRLTFERTESGIHLTTHREDLTEGEDNLIYKAALLFMDRYGIIGGVKIDLDKHIPIAAGLAGGSADAAATLVGLTKLFNIELSERELCHLGAILGSDVPFSLLGGTMLATGRGEELRRLPDLPKMHVVLAKPPLAISTAWAYQAYDEVGTDFHPDCAAMERAIAAGDRDGVAALLSNVLERVSIKKCPEIADYREKMKQAGALAAMMSGSGPTVFGLAETKEAAENIAESLRKEAGAEVFVTETYGKGCKAE